SGCCVSLRAVVLDRPPRLLYQVGSWWRPVWSADLQHRVIGRACRLQSLSPAFADRGVRPDGARSTGDQRGFAGETQTSLRWLLRTPVRRRNQPAALELWPLGAGECWRELGDERSVLFCTLKFSWPRGQR